VLEGAARRKQFWQYHYFNNIRLLLRYLSLRYRGVKPKYEHIKNTYPNKQNEHVSDFVIIEFREEIIRNKSEFTYVMKKMLVNINKEMLCFLIWVFLHLTIIKSVVENDLDMEKVWQRKLRRIWQMKNKMVPASSTSSIECAT